MLYETRRVVTMMGRPWSSDAGLVREVQHRFDSAIASYRANPHLIAEHANHEESIRVGGYAHRTLLELVQNAADAMAAPDSHDAASTSRVELVLDQDRRVLYCANSGRPFSADGVAAITHAHLSGKRGDEIGRFGLGFKSVLAVSDTPSVFSRSVSFRFSSSDARTALQSSETFSRRFPVLRTPTVIDPEAAMDKDPLLAELGAWATTVVVLPNATNLERLRDEMKNFDSEFLLFVGAVREIRLRVIGGEGFTTSHTSKNLGDDTLRIERPDGTGEDWIVVNEMHEPSPESRVEVGEAVSRSRIKVTVAVPKRYAKQRIGRFWSYFPLQDRTSASALFNAPWSVNDDRTTLLRNGYNREILRTLASMFVDLLPRVSTENDPAAHLDFMPARGRETLSFGDEILCAHVPTLTSDRHLVPDATGTLQPASALRPLDFAVGVKAPDHEAWSASPNTGTDVPHSRCYSSDQRVTRLRDIFISSIHDRVSLVRTDRDDKKALEVLPKRGLLSWLREWADGSDLASSADALRFVVKNPGMPEIEKAKVIPTTHGMRSLSDRYKVFLEQEEDIQIDNAVFVDDRFLAQAGVRTALVTKGFRNLDPLAILKSRTFNVGHASSPEEWSKLWSAVLDVPVREAVKVLAGHSGGVKVPTLDGGWAWPRQVFHPDLTLDERFNASLLDPSRCLPDVAHQIGVTRRPTKAFAVDDEPFFDEYRKWVLGSLNSDLGPGERPVERIEFDQFEGPGPFSMLLMLKEAGAPAAERARWTMELLSLDDPNWICEDRDTERAFNVVSPVRWAVDEAGVLNSNRGFRSPSGVVAPSLVKYADVLPLFQGPRRVVDVLQLPDELESVPEPLLRESLEAELFPPRLTDSFLVDFIETVCGIAYPGTHPTRIPARAGRAVQSFPPMSVYLATDEEQTRYLLSRKRPHLTVDPSRAERFIDIVGCRRFEDSFAFSMLIEGRQPEISLLDLFPGLRGNPVAGKLADATVARAALIVKRVTTKDGKEDQPRPWHREGHSLVVPTDADEKQVLNLVNEAFDLKFSKVMLEQVLQAGLSHQLELYRQEAHAADSVAASLDVYIGPDDLKESLPKGLWPALEAQGLVNDATSVAELFLTVYGADSIHTLKDKFIELGFTDVPKDWVGLPPTVSWLRKMGFGPEYAGRRNIPQEQEFVVPGAIRLSPLHQFQEKLSQRLRDVLTLREVNGQHLKAMVELPTGAGKTRVATETVLRLFVEGKLRGPVLWIAQSKELCEQAVQTWSMVWRGLDDERPLTVGRLWDTNTVHEPDTEFSVIVATDAKLGSILRNASEEYRWLSSPSAVIIDEGHRAGDSPLYTKILTWLGVAGRSWERPLVGLTATPFKGTSESATAALASRFDNRKLDVFEGNAYQYLADIGVLARVQHQVLPGATVSLEQADIDEANQWNRLSGSVLGKIGRSQSRLKILVNHIMELDPSWPVLVFTPDVLSAQVLAATLRYRGVAAASVSGQTGRQARRDTIEQFKGGQIRVLTNCDLLIQGFDAPGVRALYIARPTFSPNAYIQMAGRGLRGPANGGKEECLIVDMDDDLGDFTQKLSYREYENLWLEQRS